MVDYNKIFKVNDSYKETEEFTWIKGYEQQYMIGNHGTVVSTKYNKFKKLKQEQLKDGYMRVKLYNNKRASKYLVHRLVAEMFIPNPDNKPEVDHIDCNKSNNYMGNLRWTTHKGNTNNENTIKKYQKRVFSEETRLKMSLSQMGKGNFYKATNINTGEVFIFKSLTDLVNKGYSQSCVSRCCNGKKKQYRGFVWEYINKNK